MLEKQNQDKMKVNFRILLTIVPLFTCKAQEISFEKEIHDFGTFEQNGNGTYEFKFTNSGDAPLIISNSKGSWGCTVPVWPKEPIAPGESNVIKVKYDTKRIGAFNKSITIMTKCKTCNKSNCIKGNLLLTQLQVL